MDILTRNAAGLPPDPWSALDLDTADATRAGILAGAAVSHQSMVWILGQRGSGKTRAVRRALRDAGAQLIEPLRLDREKLHMGDIQTAIVRELAPDERPRSSGEARSGQVKRLLAAAKRPPVLWIDEAHCLHHATLRGLKRLRELSWRGRSPLLGVVLSGQREPGARVAEVALRSDRLQMAGLTAEEATGALEGALGATFAPAARSVVAADDRARNWLDLQALADDCLRLAVSRGTTAVDEAIAREVVSPGHDPIPPAPGDDDVARRLRRAA